MTRGQGVAVVVGFAAALWAGVNTFQPGWHFAAGAVVALVAVCAFNIAEHRR